MLAGLGIWILWILGKASKGWLYSIVQRIGANNHLWKNQYAPNCDSLSRTPMSIIIPEMKWRNSIPSSAFYWQDEQQRRCTWFVHTRSQPSARSTIRRICNTLTIYRGPIKRPFFSLNQRKVLWLSLHPRILPIAVLLTPILRRAALISLINASRLSFEGHVVGGPVRDGRKEGRAIVSIV